MIWSQILSVIKAPHIHCPLLYIIHCPWTSINLPSKFCKEFLENVQILMKETWYFYCTELNFQVNGTNSSLIRLWKWSERQVPRNYDSTNFKRNHLALDWPPFYPASPSFLWNTSVPRTEHQFYTRLTQIVCLGQIDVSGNNLYDRNLQSNGQDAVN